MAVLYDARGNEITGQDLDQITGLTVVDIRTSTALLAAVNAESVMDLNGKAVATVDVRTAAANLTLVFEGTIDGTNYVTLIGFVLTHATVALIETMLASVVITSTHAGVYVIEVSGYRRFRVRVSAYTSGNVTVALRASAADHAVYARPIPSTLHITATAAANTGATATLPAAGAGLYHYITNINLMRNATAALAGTATLIHTSTNLPGSPAWSVGNAMIAGGTETDLDYTPTTPLRSLVPNTATTVVMPAAGLAVLNRVNVSYYIGA